MFKNKPWKSWKTRKVTLMFSIFAVIAYTVTAIVLTINETPLDATLTEQVFIYFTALPVTGCAITIAKVVKGKSNTDADEPIVLDESDNIINYELDEEDEDLEEDELEYASELSEKPKRIVKGELI